MAALVSIIIPFYNSEKFLSSSIDSALSQTWPNIEIILIDDGSSDESYQVAKAFEGPGVKIFKQLNQGASVARNRGILESKGDFIQFLDSDDLLSANKIEQQMKLIADNDDIVAICPAIHFYDKVTKDLVPSAYESQFYIESNSPFEFLLNLYGAGNNQGGMIPLHCWLTPRNVIEKAGLWNETLSLNDDGEFFCRVAINSRAIKLAKTTYCFYRKYSASGSLSSLKSLEGFKSLFDSLILINRHLKGFSDDKRINTVTTRALIELAVSTFPIYKSLTKEVLGVLKDLGGTTYLPSIGGPITDMAVKF